MKLSSTNVVLLVSKEIGWATLGQKGKQRCFIQEKHLEELRDLLNDYLEMKKRGSPNSV